jgi:hypothetical protein
MQRDPDATMPVPTGGGEPTIPAGGLGDPTMPVTRPEYGGPGAGGPGGPGDSGGGGWDGEDEEGDRRKFWMIAGGVLVLGLLVGALVAILLSSGGDNKTAATTSSSSSTTSTSLAPTTAPTTTPTTAVPAPQILQFAANPSPYQCPGSGNLQLTWATQNTSGVTVSIDGPGPYGNYQSTGNQSVPFSCPANQHTYLLTANGSNGQKTQKTLVVQGVPAPTTVPPTT